MNNCDFKERLNTSPSAVFSVFYKEEVVHLTIDSGCTGNIIRKNIVEHLEIPMKPSNVRAKLADNKTYLDIVGKVSVEFIRGKHSFKFDAVVATNLGPDVLAGTPFLKENDIMTDFVNEVIIVGKRIRFPFTTQHVIGNSADTLLVRVLKSKVVLPGEFMDIKIPKSLPPSETFVVEKC